MVNAKPFGGLNCKRAPLREETSHSAYLEPWVQGSGWGERLPPARSNTAEDGSKFEDYWLYLFL